MAAHVYLITPIDGRSAFSIMRWRMMFVAQQGNLRFVTNSAGSISNRRDRGDPARGKIPRRNPGGPARGYLCEKLRRRFTLPSAGRSAPTASPMRGFPDARRGRMRTRTRDRTVRVWGGQLFMTKLRIRRIDVVHGTGQITAPYKYDLRTFSPIGAIGFDHSDPRLHGADLPTVGNRGHRQHRFCHLPTLGCRGKYVSAAVVSHEHHVEFMGLIYGVYDAKPPRLYARRIQACTT